MRPCGQQPTRLLCPQDSLGKNTGVGCHFLLLNKCEQLLNPGKADRLLSLTIAPHPLSSMSPWLFHVSFFFFLMWTIFKVFIDFVTTLLLFYVLVFRPQGMWDLSLLTRDCTHGPCIERWSLNHWTTRFWTPCQFLKLISLLNSCTSSHWRRESLKVIWINPYFSIIINTPYSYSLLLQHSPENFEGHVLRLVSVPLL